MNFTISIVKKYLPKSLLIEIIVLSSESRNSIPSSFVAQPFLLPPPPPPPRGGKSCVNKTSHYDNSPPRRARKTKRDVVIGDDRGRLAI